MNEENEEMILLWVGSVCLRLHRIIPQMREKGEAEKDIKSTMSYEFSAQYQDEEPKL